MAVATTTVTNVWLLTYNKHIINFQYIHYGLIHSLAHFKAGQPALKQADPIHNNRKIEANSKIGWTASFESKVVAQRKQIY